MNIIIAETAIDLVPDDWLTSPKIKKYYKKNKRKPIIDGSIHQHLLKSIPLENRKDRPDILHFSLLLASGYQKIIPNLKLFFSTKTKTFEVMPETKLPRSQYRFNGILELLLSNQNKSPLIQNSNLPPLTVDNTILFSTKGRDLDPTDFQKSNFIFGGFAHGSFDDKKYSQFQKVKLIDQPLELWTALSLFLGNYKTYLNEL